MSKPRAEVVLSQRADFPEIMGWMEVVSASGLTPAGVLYRTNGKDFPTPVAVLSSSPIWLAEEIREYFATHSVQPRLTGEQRELIRRESEAGATDGQLAETFGVTPTTIARIRRGHR